MPNAKPYEFRNLAQTPDDNTGGIEAAWYTLATDLVNFPVNGELPIDQLKLRDGATWYQLVSTRGTVRYKQTPKDLGRHGQSFTQRIVGVLPRHTADLVQGIEALEGQPLVLLYRDLNGQVQVVGTPEQPLAWTDAYDSGENPTQRNNYDWTLAGETPRRARPYLGTWDVSGVGLTGGLQLGSGPGGSVILRTPGGRILAVVPAGKSIVLKSDFQLNYQIV
jgi:hypothetical protein